MAWHPVPSHTFCTGGSAFLSFVDALKWEADEAFALALFMIAPSHCGWHYRRGGEVDVKAWLASLRTADLKIQSTQHETYLSPSTHKFNKITFFRIQVCFFQLTYNFKNFAAPCVIGAARGCNVIKFWYNISLYFKQACVDTGVVQ